MTFTRINYLEYENQPLAQSAWCGLPYNEPDKLWELVMLSSTVIFFLIPLVIISFLYYQIARKLKKATKLDPSNQSDMHLTDHATSRKIIQSRKMVIRMLGEFAWANHICHSRFAWRQALLHSSLICSSASWHTRTPPPSQKLKKWFKGLEKAIKNSEISFCRPTVSACQTLESMKCYLTKWYGSNISDINQIECFDWSLVIVTIVNGTNRMPLRDWASTRSNKFHLVANCNINFYLCTFQLWSW